MCDGGLSRLTERYIAAKIVAAALTMLATLTNRTCMAAGESGDLPPDATKLVWDALLGGRELVPDAFADDRIINVLAEDCRPAWLACLGALRER